MKIKIANDKPKQEKSVQKRRNLALTSSLFPKLNAILVKRCINAKLLLSFSFSMAKKYQIKFLRKVTLQNQ